MGIPNYSYCKEYCLGKTPNCPHYERANRLFKVCYHYKLLSVELPNALNLTEKDISRLEKIANDRMAKD